MSENFEEIISKIPEEYLCTISYKLLDDPCIDPTNGKTYDSETFKKCDENRVAITTGVVRDGGNVLGLLF